MTQSQPDVQIYALRKQPSLIYPLPDSNITPVSSGTDAFDAVLHIGHEGREIFHKIDDLYLLLHGEKEHLQRPERVMSDLLRKNFKAKGLKPYILLQSEDGSYYNVMSKSEKYLRINQANVYMDSHDFRERAGRLLEQPKADISADEMQAVLAIYQNHFLNGYRLQGKDPNFQAWVRRVRSELASLWEHLQILLVRYYIREKDISSARAAALAWLDLAQEKTWPLHYLIWLSLPEDARLARRYIRQLANEETRLRDNGQICRQPLSSKWQMYLDAKTQPPLSVLDTSLYPERLSDTAQEVLSILSRQTALPVIILNAPPGGGKTRTLNEIARYARRSGVFDEVVQWQPVAGDNVVSIRWMMDQLQMDFSPAASLTDRRNRLKDELIRRRYLFLVDDTSPERWQPLIELLEDTPGHLILTQTGTHPTKYLDISVPALDKTAVQQILLSYDVPVLTAAQLDSLMHLTGGLPLLVHLFGSMTRQNNQTHHTFNPATFIKHYQTLDGSDHQTPDDRYTYFMAVLWDYLFPKTRQALYALSLYDAIGATREDLQALLGYEDDELQILLEQLAAFCEEDAPLRLHRVLIQQVRQWTDRYKREARSLQALERGFIRERLARLQPSQYNFEYLDQHFGHIEQALTLLQTVTIQPERLLAYVETLWNLRYYLEHRHAYDLLEGTVTTLLQALDNVDEAAVAATDDELPYARMHLLQMAAQITIRQGHYEVALTQLEDGLALCRQYGWQEAEGVMLVDMGVVYQRTADYETALDYFQQGEDCLPASVRSDIWNRLRINRTLVYRAMNETDKVSASYQDIISSGNEGGLDVHQTYTYLWALLCRGNQLFWDKSYDEAREGYLELLHAARRYQNLLYEAYALLNLGVVAVWKSEPDLEQAHFYFDEALLATGMVKSPWLKTQYLYNHGALHIIEDDIPEAVSHLYRAQDIALENESAKLDAQVRVGLGILNYRISDRSMARSYWIGSIKQAPNDLRLVARALYGHALLALQAYVAESTGQPEEDTIRDLITSHIHAYNLQSLICMTISYETFNDAIDYFCQLLGEARLRMSTGAIQREMIIRSLQSALGQ